MEPSSLKVSFLVHREDVGELEPWHPWQSVNNRATLKSRMAISPEADMVSSSDLAIFFHGIDPIESEKYTLRTVSMNVQSSTIERNQNPKQPNFQERLNAGAVVLYSCSGIIIWPPRECSTACVGTRTSL